MAQVTPQLTIAAAALLRGDLEDLVPEASREVDKALQDALTLADAYPGRAAAKIRMVVDAAEPSLGARLTTYENQLKSGEIHGRDSRTTRGGSGSPPGTPGPIEAEVWTCPEEAAAHYRKRRRFPRQDMGQCPTHKVPLVPEGRSR